jgi:DNA-binding LacI/PurR family transcriptional regulator
MHSTSAADLAHQLIHEFLSAARVKGDIFWPEREIAKNHKVTRHQARCAVDYLVSRNILSRRHGSGTYLNSTNFRPVPGLSARTPRPCVILPDWEMEFATGFIAAFKCALNREALRRGWPVSFCYERSVRDDPHFIDRLVAGGTNCVVFIDIHEESIPVAGALKQAGIPVIAVGTHLPVLKSLKIPVVSPNGRAAMQDLVLALVSRGKRQIVLTGISTPVRSNDHLQGFASAYQMLGLDYPADMVVEGYDFEYLVRSLRRRFKGTRPPDAILFEECSSFLKLIELMPELPEAIRNGLTATVFDELYLDEKFRDLPVVSIRIPAETAGQKCAELIDLAIANKKVPQITKLGSSILWPASAAGSG